MFLPKNFIIPLFAITSLSLSSRFDLENVIALILYTDYLSDNGKQQKEDPLKTAMRNRIFDDAQVKAYFENPRIYEANRQALRGENYAGEAQRDLQMRRIGQQGTRMIPGGGAPIDLGGVVRERGLIFWEEDERAYKIRMQREMAYDPQEVRKVARRVREELYSPKGDKYFIDHYQKMHLYEGSSPLPNPVTFEGLKLQYPDITSMYDNKDLSDEQKLKLCSGKLGKDEFKTALNLDTEEEYNDYINKNLLSLPQASNLPKAIVDPLLTEEQLQKKKEQQLSEFLNNVDEGRDYFYAGTAILNLIDPQSSKTIAKAGEASFLIYESVGKIIINEAIDPTSLGNLANGASAIVDLLGGTPSTDQIMIEMLEDILKTQKEILSRLIAIEVKIDNLQSSVTFLIDLTKKNHRDIKREFTKINARFDGIEKSLAEERAYLDLVNQEKIILDFEQKKAGLTEPFTNRKGNSLQKELLKELKNPAQSNLQAEQHFQKINSLLGEMHNLATKQLEDSQYLTLADRSDILRLNANEIKARQDKNINPIVGMLPGIGKWLNYHREGEYPLVIYPSDYKGVILDGSNLNLNVGNPALFSTLLKNYVELALYRPIEKDKYDRIIHDDHIDDFCRDIKNIENAEIEMRQHIPLALAVYNYHLYKLKEEHYRFITDKAKKLLLTDDKAIGILFNNDSGEEIIKKIDSMKIEEFAELGTLAGIFKVQKYFYDVPSSYPFPSYKIFTTQISLSKEILAKGKKNVKFDFNITTSVSGERANKLYPDKKLPAISPEDVHSEPEIRQELQKIFVQEIFDRHNQLTEEWSKYLNDQTKDVYKIYYTNLCRARFVLETLVKGGYGTSYQYAQNLKALSDQMKFVDNISKFIESKWMTGQNVLDEFPTIEEFDNDPTVLGVKLRPPLVDKTPLPVFDFDDHGKLKINYPKKNENLIKAKSLIISDYLAHFGKFNSNLDSINHVNYVQSIVPNFEIKSSVKDPFIIEIGNLENSRKIMQFISSFPDLAPSKDCLNSFKIQP